MAFLLLDRDVKEAIRLMIQSKTLHVRHAFFFIHFFAVTTGLQLDVL